MKVRSSWSCPERDASFLAERDLAYQVVEEPGSLCLILPAWKLPAGYTQASADLLIRLPAGYPDLPPDMWWFDPAVTRPDGVVIEATQVVEVILGRSWQRWSRHLDPSHWNSGVDGLESYLSLVWREAKRSAQDVAA
jgi:hypothetical protein